MAGKAPLRPFRQGTRRHWQRVQTVVGSTSATVAQALQPILLPKTGMLAGLWLCVTGAFTSPAAGDTLAVDGLAAIFNRITVTANLGSANVVDASGKGVETASRFARAKGPRGTVSALAAGANTFTYNLFVPISANSGSNFEIGLINLQDPQIQVFLNITQAALNSVFVPVNGAQTNSAITTTFDVFIEYYEIPDPTRFALPPRSIVRTLEDLQGALVVGDNIYQMPRMGTLLDYAQICIFNSISATAAQVQSLKLRFNKTNVVEERSGQLSLAITNYLYPDVPVASTGTVAPTYSEAPAGFQPGVFDWSYWAAQGIPNSGDLRDAIDTEEIVTTEFINTVATGTTIVATDTIRHVRRIAQML